MEAYGELESPANDRLKSIQYLAISYRKIPKGMGRNILMVTATNCSGSTDIGLRRKNNEDAFITKPDLGLYVVADGMGGAAAGEVASDIFVQTTLKVFKSGSDRSDKETLSLVQRAFFEANESIQKHVREFPEHDGMGCTAEVIAFCHEGFVLGHVGDSRTYHFKDSELTQLSKDHSMVQEQIDKGVITPAEIKNHPMRNIILRAVGVKETVAPDFLTGNALTNDLFLLCSDGLTDMLTDEAIADVLRSVDTVVNKTEKLIKLAKSAGGHDNITVVLAQVD